MHVASTLELMSLAERVQVQRALQVHDGYLRVLWLRRGQSIRTCFRRY